MSDSLWLSWIDSIPIAKAQSATFPLKIFNPSNVDPTTLLYVLVGLAVSIFGLILIAFYYRRWRQFNEFLSEMKSLDLNPEAEGTFAWMVKRHQLKEPVQVLHSRQVFDEMASDEIFRVLASAGTLQAKQQFIDTVYDIRVQTFHPQWQQYLDKQDSV